MAAELKLGQVQKAVMPWVLMAINEIILPVMLRLSIYTSLLCYR
jgi:hypothetical protein